MKKRWCIQYTDSDSIFERLGRAFIGGSTFIIAAHTTYICKVTEHAAIAGKGFISGKGQSMKIGNTGLFS